MNDIWISFNKLQNLDEIVNKQLKEFDLKINILKEE
jgi:hypothetical protein